MNQPTNRRIPILTMLAGVAIFSAVFFFSGLLPSHDSCSKIVDASLGPPITAKTECYTELALKKKNPELCNRVGGKVTNKYREDALEYCIKQYAFTLNAPSACDYLRNIYDGQEDERCREEAREYNYLGKYQQYISNTNSASRVEALELGYAQKMQEAANQQFKGTLFSWTIHFDLIDETAQYTDCRSKGTMKAVLKNRSAWDDLDLDGKKGIVSKLMVYVYGYFGSKQVVEVYYGDLLLARGDDAACGKKSLLEEIEIL